MKKIVVDPGHGGSDPGASAYGLAEKELSLNIARRLAQKLAAYRDEVILTRNDDTYVSLQARANLANRSGADFFLSIHINAGGGEGFESYVHPDAPAVTRAIRATLHREVAVFLQPWGVADRGMKEADFAVLRLTGMPSTLLELLFIDNPRDIALLQNDAFLDSLADATVRGLAAALNLTPAPPDPSPTPTPAPWDPQQEIEKLKNAGIIVSDHEPADPVTWGELATVINKVLARL